MSVKVAVRCRPLNSREKSLGSACVVSMKGNTTVLHAPPPAAQGSSGNPAHSSGIRQFTFDHSFWSANRKDSEYASQSYVYSCVGEKVLEDAFAGYNSCVFAYGQTGAGKSYSMMGGSADEDKGIIPRLCEGLFSQIQDKRSPQPDTPIAGPQSRWTAKVEVSYMEIYLERVRDLLNPESEHNLRVREHSSTGPYVEGLSKHAVANFDMVKRLMNDGNKVRTVKSTAMNDVSSRSHAIFQLIFTQVEETERSGRTVRLERVSKISLVDLAGSERSGQINSADSDRLKEGNKINQSLSTLGKVISVLADHTTKGKKTHVPYRESVLTWLLRESLGGNSKTIMLAAISPAAANYEETLSTLRYASQAKRIVNRAVVNEDATATMVRKLNEEIRVLREQLANASAAQSRTVTSPNSGKFMSVEEVTEALEESERLMEDLTQTWEQKLAKTLEMQQARRQRLSELGIDENDQGLVGVRAPRSTPFLMNLSSAAVQENECMMYYLFEGVTVVTQRGYEIDMEESTDDIFIMELSGNIHDEHCEFHCLNVHGKLIVSLNPLDNAPVWVNDMPISSPLRLKSGDTIRLSDTHTFKFQHPGDTRSRASRNSTRHSSPTFNAADIRLEQPSAAGVAHSPRRTLPNRPSQAALVDSSTPGTAGPSAASAFSKSKSSSYLLDVRTPTAFRRLSGSEANPISASTPMGVPEGKAQWREAAAGGEAATPTNTAAAFSFPGRRQLPSIEDAGQDGTPTSRRAAQLKLEERRLIAEAKEGVALAREAAFLEYDVQDEDRYLALLIPAMDHQEVAFKLLPCYGLYMMARHCQVYTPGRLSQYFDKVNQLLDMLVTAVCEGQDMSHILFWMTNVSELIACIRLDVSLAVFAPQLQISFTQMLQTALSRFVSLVNHRLKPFLPAIITECVDIFPDYVYVPASPPAAVSKSRSSSSFWSMSSSRAASTSSLQPVDAAAGKSATPASMESILDTLEVLHELARACNTSSSLAKQLFQSIFYFIGSSTFNSMMYGPSEWFCARSGVIISYNLAQLLDWASARSLGSMDSQLTHLNELAKLLVIRKDSISQIDTICLCGSHLNSLQLETVLTKFQPGPDEPGIPMEVLASVKGRAIHEHDPLCMDDDSVGGRMMLLRNESYVLPFRLQRECHCSRGLVSLEMIAYIQSVVEELMHSHSSSQSPDAQSDTSSFGHSTSSLPARLEDCSEDALAWAQIHDFVRHDPALPIITDPPYEFFEDTMS